MKHTLMKFKEAFAMPLRNGLTKPSKVRGSGIPMVNMKEIFAYNKIYDDTPMELVPVTEKELENTSLEFGDLLFARQSLTEEGAGKVCIYNGHQTKVFESHLIRCRLDQSRFNSDYFYYFFSSSTGKALVSTIVQQTAAAGIRGSDLQELEIPVPPLPEQKAIASVLSSLDDKIDLLHRQNKTLEAMAETLFRQWFIEEAKEDWEVTPLSRIFDFLEGPGIRNWQYVENGVNFINIRLIDVGEVNVNSANKISEEEAFGKYKHFMLEEGDLIVSTSGTLGKSAIIRKYHLPLCLNTSVIRFRPKQDIYREFMYSYLKSRVFLEELETTASGSVQLNFGPTHLKKIDIRLPPTELIMSYHTITSEVFNKINSNFEQIQTLEKLRDTLLPKLMSGEVRVQFKQESAA